jgi:hypothetical protein
MSKFKVGDKVTLINPDTIEYTPFMEGLLGKTLVVRQIIQLVHNGKNDNERILAGIHGKGEWIWRAEDLRLVPETPADEVLHYWAVIDKNGKRVGGFSDSIAAAATDLSRSVEELLRAL